MAFPFPIFPDGDVHITVGGEEYQLHAGLLMDRSPMIKLLLAPLLSERTSSEDHIHLAVVVQGRRDEVGYLAVVDQASTAHDSGSEGHASENDATEERDDANEEDSDDEGLSQATCEAWANAFRCVYDLRVDLRSLDDEELLDHCWAILNITSHLGIKTEIVTWCISCGLAQRQGDVSRVISEDPVSWVILSRHMRLAWVFVESVNRLVEQWRTIPAERLQDVTMDTLSLCRTLRRSLLRGTFTGVEEDDCPWYAFPDSSEGDVPILDEVDDLRPLLPEFIALVNHWGMEVRGGQQPRLDHAELPVASSVEEASQAPQTDTTTRPGSQATDQLPGGDVEVVRADLQAW